MVSEKRNPTRSVNYREKSLKTALFQVIEIEKERKSRIHS